jgi:SAM-dependent methyltransferase
MQLTARLRQDEQREAARYNALYARGYPAGASAAGLAWAEITEARLRVLDVGCGWAPLATRFDDYTGIDVSDYVIAHNRATLPGRFMVCGALDAWRVFADEVFGLVVALDVLEHFPAESLDDYLSSLAKIDSPLFLFSICCRPSVLKDVNGGALHLSVFSRDDWLIRLAGHFSVYAASELNRQQTFHVLLGRLS